MKQTIAEKQIKLRKVGKIDRATMRAAIWHDGNGIVQFTDGSCMWTTQDPRVPLADACAAASSLEDARKARAESLDRYNRGLAQ